MHTFCSLFPTFPFGDVDTYAISFLDVLGRYDEKMMSTVRHSERGSVISDCLVTVGLAMSFFRCSWTCPLIRSCRHTD